MNIGYSSIIGNPYAVRLINMNNRRESYPMTEETARKILAAQQSVQSDKCPICNGDKYVINGLGLQEDCYFCDVTGICR